MRKLLTVLIIVFVCVLAANAQEAPFTRTAMLQNITETLILPLHMQFRDATAALQTAWLHANGRAAMPLARVQGRTRILCRICPPWREFRGEG